MWRTWRTSSLFSATSYSLLDVFGAGKPCHLSVLSILPSLVLCCVCCWYMSTINRLTPPPPPRPPAPAPQIDSSDDDRSSFSDSSQTSHRNNRGLGGSSSRAGGGSGGLFADEPFSSLGTTTVDSVTGAVIVPPCQRGFTPGLTAAEAIKLARQNASAAAEARLTVVTLGTAGPPTSAALEGGGMSVDGSFPPDDGRGSPSDEVVAAGSGGWAEAISASEAGGGGGKSGRVSPGGGGGWIGLDCWCCFLFQYARVIVLGILLLGGRGGTWCLVLVSVGVTFGPAVSAHTAVRRL